VSYIHSSQDSKAGRLKRRSLRKRGSPVYDPTRVAVFPPGRFLYLRTPSRRASVGGRKQWRVMRRKTQWRVTLREAPFLRQGKQGRQVARNKRAAGERSLASIRSTFCASPITNHQSLLTAHESPLTLLRRGFGGPANHRISNRHLAIRNGCKSLETHDAGTF
jgi:hypothetical protein